MQVRDVLDKQFLDAFALLRSKEISISTAIKISKIAEQLEEIRKRVSANIQSIYLEYCDRNDSDSPKVIDNRLVLNETNQNIVTKVVEEILNTDIEHPGIVYIDELEGITITGDALCYLKEIVCYRSL